MRVVVLCYRRSHCEPEPSLSSPELSFRLMEVKIPGPQPSATPLRQLTAPPQAASNAEMQEKVRDTVAAYKGKVQKVKRDPVAEEEEQLNELKRAMLA